MSVTARLVILVVAVLAPAVAAAVWGIHQTYRAQKETAEQSLRQLAHALAQVVDEELSHRAGVLETLARSPALLRGDLRAFYAFARSIAPTDERTIVLSDLEGRQLMNTRLPPGSARLPSRSPLPDLRRQLNLPQDAVLVSDAYFAPVGKQYSFAIQVPVMKDGQVAYYLSMGSFGSSLQKMLSDQRLRPEWNAAILDRHGTVLARRIQPERFVGKPATGDMIANLRQAREGLFETVRLDGVATLTAFAPVGQSGWTFVVSMPKSELQAGLTRTILTASIVTLTLFGLAILIALLVGRSITRPLHELVHSAAELGQGRQPRPPRHRLKESRLIAAELERASAQLRAANRQLETRVEAAVAQSKRAQDALLQNQKLEALGRLTGGIAHDFNNLLQTISVTMEIVLRQAVNPAVIAAAEAGKRAVHSAVKLTGQLMTFGRTQAASRETIDLRDQVAQLEDLIERALRGNIELSLRFAEDLWPVTVDPVQLELALLNAALNSRDAMPQGGRLVISAHNTRMVEGAQPGLAPGDYVELCVSDTGKGIPPELLPRVFEPFFTTKEVGKGSGIGLAQIYGFATQSGGSAAIRSDTGGGGTQLLLWLPREVTARSAAEEQAVPEAALPHAGGTILFVEDDGLVRSVMGPALEGAGFRVLLARDAESARAVLERDGEAVDAVVSDIVMPGGVSGVELARELRRSRPSLPVLLATGYADAHAPPAGVRVLRKPYRLEELTDALRRALGERGSKAG